MVGAVLLLIGFPLVHADTGILDDPVITGVSSTVQQGGLLEVVIRGDGIASIQSATTLSDRFVVHSHGWRVAAKEGIPSGEVWVLLIGIPSFSPLGTGTVEIAVDRGEHGIAHLRQNFEVIDEVFRLERIALGTSLTAIRAQPDPRKTKESQILWELLNSTDLDGRFHTGAFAMPLDSIRYTSHFGDRRTYAYADGNEARSIHNGVDFGAPTGTPILSPARGRIRMATDRIVTGGTIVVEHAPSVYTLYYHLHTILVAVGDDVEIGDLLGTVGSTGLSTGPHLHWELRVSGVAVDPAFVTLRPLLDTTAVIRSLSLIP